MRKRKLKILLAAIAAALMLCLPVCASAAEAEETSVAPESAPVESAEAADENVFAIAYEAVMAHSAELLSALAFIGTVIVGFAYKKGLLPLISKALSALGGTVERIKEQTERSDATAEEALAGLGRRLDVMETSLAGFSELLYGTRESVDTLCSSEDMQGRMRAIMSAQIEMLYEIFMSSSLPAYQKESVGERISAMKRMLEENGDNAK